MLRFKITTMAYKKYNYLYIISVLFDFSSRKEIFCDILNRHNIKYKRELQIMFKPTLLSIYEIIICIRVNMRPRKNAFCITSPTVRSRAVR